MGRGRSAPESRTQRRAAIGVAAALTWEIAVAVVDAATGSDVILTGLFLIGPVGLALVGTVRQTAAVGVLAVVLALASGAWDGFLFSLDHLVRVCVVLSGSALAVLAAGARARAEAASAAETVALADAEDVVSRLRSAQERLDRTLTALAEAVTVHDAEGRVVFANPAAIELLGVPSADDVLLATPEALAGRFEHFREDGTPLDPSDAPSRRLTRGEPVEPLLVRRHDRRTGENRWLYIKATRIAGDRGEPLAVNVIEDVTDAKEQELQERFLSRASELLSASLDYELTLQRVAELAVPEVADWCGVEIVDEGGQSRQVAVGHVDPSKVALARELRVRYPPDPDDEFGVPGVLRTGRPQLIPTVTDEMLVAGAQDEEHLRIARELRMSSAMIVPMLVGARVIGAITFVAAESGGSFDEGDLAFAQQLAARASVAVENARLYRDRTRAAETLQRSLLPAHVPELPGWRAAARYRPADQLSQVGGDFYDLFPVEDGFVVVLGDVVGKGVAAAALTALARHSAKTAALLGHSPAGVLRLLNRVLLGEPGLSLVTVVCAHVVARNGRATMTVALGGHPPALLLRAGEAPSELGHIGMLLGVQAVDEWPEHVVDLNPGDVVLFYTDGVIDTPGAEERFGERRLHEVLADAPADPERLLETVDDALRAFQATGAVDDTAMVALQLVGRPPYSPAVRSGVRSTGSESSISFVKMRSERL